LFTNCKTDSGIERLAEYIVHDVLFDMPPRVSGVETPSKNEGEDGKR
jgi:hypothetical protein